MMNILIYGWKTYVFLAYLGIFLAWSLWENHKLALQGRSLDWLPNTALLIQQLNEKIRLMMSKKRWLLCSGWHGHDEHWAIQDHCSSRPDHGSGRFTNRP